LRVRMNAAQREVAEREPESIAELLADLLHDGMRRAAIRALVVPVLHQCDAGPGWTESVVALVQRRGELGGRRGHHATAAGTCMVSSARRMPSAPGFTPIGET